jgi:hypothetical protein
MSDSRDYLTDFFLAHLLQNPRKKVLFFAHFFSAFFLVGCATPPPTAVCRQMKAVDMKLWAFVLSNMLYLLVISAKTAVTAGHVAERAKSDALLP